MKTPVSPRWRASVCRRKMGRSLSELGLVAVGAGLAGLLVLAACSGKGAEQQGSATSDTAAGSSRGEESRPAVGPIVVLGFDGADPDRVERLEIPDDPGGSTP